MVSFIVKPAITAPMASLPQPIVQTQPFLKNSRVTITGFGIVRYATKRTGRKETSTT